MVIYFPAFLEKKFVINFFASSSISGRTGGTDKFTSAYSFWISIFFKINVGYQYFFKS